MTCKHSAGIVVNTGWLMHAMCGDCGAWFAVELDISAIMSNIGRRVAADNPRPITRFNHLVTHEGRTQSLAEWASELGVDPQLLYARYRRGWESGDLLYSERKRRRSQPSRNVPGGSNFGFTGRHT